MEKRNRVANPELFQGRNKKKDYFEGWYFKHSTKDKDINFSIIPGVNYEKNKKSAFIQVIIGPEYKSYYINYDYTDFSYTDNPFSVKIGNNLFSTDCITLDIETDNVKLKGKIEYKNISPINQSICQPNIMGFFAYFKFMQCNHGVISLNHSLSGQISYNGSDIDFNSGKGYIEKDWGTSFPKKYCWIQCNHFSEEENSLFFSFAHIPFLGSEFMGFISILKVGNKQYRFATYNRAKVKKISFENNILEVEIKRNKQLLKVKAYVKNGRVLKAPKQGIMEDDIKETMGGNVEVSLYIDNKLEYIGNSDNVAVEVVNI